MKGIIMSKSLCLIVLSSLIFITATLAQKLPSFKIVGKIKPGIGIAILVSSETTDDELKLLINEFRKARTENTLSRMIPPTTPGGPKGDYFSVWIYVFTEASWASTERLKKFVNASAYSKSDLKYSREYAHHIRAEYYFLQGESEYGILGYEDETGSYRSKNYMKLF
jgi:hypothetical protein